MNSLVRCWTINHFAAQMTIHGNAGNHEVTSSNILRDPLFDPRFLREVQAAVFESLGVSWKAERLVDAVVLPRLYEFGFQSDRFFCRRPSLLAAVNAVEHRFSDFQSEDTGADGNVL